MPKNKDKAFRDLIVKGKFEHDDDEYNFYHGLTTSQQKMLGMSHICYLNVIAKLSPAGIIDHLNSLKNGTVKKRDSHITVDIPVKYVEEIIDVRFI